MRRSWKQFFFYFTGIVILINHYHFSRVDLPVNGGIDGTTDHTKKHYYPVLELLGLKRTDQKADNEFLVLDWIGVQHIVQEPDPIPCNFSHITPEYCRSRFLSITNASLQSFLIERCSRLPSLVVRWTADQDRLSQANLVAFHAIQMTSDQFPRLERDDQQQQYSSVYALESEVHSQSNSSWKSIDFPMWYNFAHSYPEPATYFDNHIYLNQLFAPVRVPFSKKNQEVSTVWVTSNCNAYNGRHVFVTQLMSHMRIDSLGTCLNNVPKKSVNSIDRKSNAVIYASYKFVIAIENSNCEDFVTEKFIDAIASTAIPIVASRNHNPDYLRFAPRYSYINVYDYKSVEELANYLHYLSINETAYNEYLWYRPQPTEAAAAARPTQRSLNDNLRLARERLGKNATMCQWLLKKETSINKYCKLTQFIKTSYWQWIFERKKIDRPTGSDVCLPENDLATHFKLSSTWISG